MRISTNSKQIWVTKRNLIEKKKEERNELQQQRQQTQ